VTVEAPVVTRPNVAPRDHTASIGPIRRASSPVDAATEPASGSRVGGTVAVPSASSNALITVVVVALVTLAVAVFVLLRR
jgi:hypothetical protein